MTEEKKDKSQDDLTDNPFAMWTLTSEGLSKREHYAAMAMQGLLAYDRREHSDWIAKRSVELADALIAELEKDK